MFHDEAPPSEDKSKDEGSIDNDTQTQTEVTPILVIQISMLEWMWRKCSEE